MTPEQLQKLDWSKGDGLLPAVVQDSLSGQVLMLGYMSPQSLEATLESGFVTFFSRSRGRLWMKGETSGNRLRVVNVLGDCDEDSLLVLADPEGPTCHLGTKSCFGTGPATEGERLAFLGRLETVIAERISSKPEGSYTARMWCEGPSRIAKKVGEEGVEVALAAVTEDDARLLGESADLLYHLALLLKTRNLSLASVIEELERRHASKP